MGIGDWGLGIGDWGLGPIPNPQSPIPNPQLNKKFFLKVKIKIIFIYLKIIKQLIEKINLNKLLFYLLLYIILIFMGCSNNDYGIKTNEDFFTKSFYESSKEKRKYENNYIKKNNSNNNNKSHTSNFSDLNIYQNKSYFDNLINNEIPKMDFGKLAEETELVKDFENRDGIYKDNNSSNQFIDEEKKTIKNNEKKTSEKSIQKKLNKNLSIKTDEEKKIKNNELENNSDDENIKSEEILSDNKNKDFSQIYKFSETIKFKFNSPFPLPAKLPILDFSPNLSKLTISIIGKEKSGKTSLFTKYIHNKFPKNYESTIEINENSDMNFNYNNKNIQLIIIDTPPIPKYDTFNIVQEQINKSHIIIYIFDATEEDIIFSIKLTFKNFDFIKEQIVCILANKMDIRNKNTEENINIVENFCKERNYDFIPISVLEFESTDITELFEEIVMDYFKKYKY